MVGTSSPVLAAITFALAILQTFAFTSQAAFASDNLAHGATLFEANCAGCHRGGMNFIKEKKTLQKDALEKFIGSTEAVKIQNMVQKGMPHKLLPFAKEFSSEDYADVASFVSDQDIGEKW